MNQEAKMEAKPKFPRVPLKRTPSGLIAIEQGQVGNNFISFCPDDDRFHVHLAEFDARSVKTFNHLKNAVQWARLNQDVVRFLEESDEE